MNRHYISNVINASELDNKIDRLARLTRACGCTDYMFSNKDLKGVYVLASRSMSKGQEELMRRFLKSIRGSYDIRIYGHSINIYNPKDKGKLGFFHNCDPVTYNSKFYIAMKANEPMVCYLMANIFRDFSMTIDYLNSFPLPDECLMNYSLDSVLTMMSYMSIFYALYKPSSLPNNFSKLFRTPKSNIGNLIKRIASSTSERSDALSLIRVNSDITRRGFREMIESGVVTNYYDGITEHLGVLNLRHKLKISNEENRKLKSEIIMLKDEKKTE